MKLYIISSIRTANEVDEMARRLWEEGKLRLSEKDIFHIDFYEKNGNSIQKLRYFYKLFERELMFYGGLLI